MEHALDLCELPCTKKGNVLYAPAQKAQCDDSPVRAWDQAVAFYAGSMEGESGVGDGVLLFDLADTMCARFMACGDDAELRFGISYANNVAINTTARPASLMPRRLRSTPSSPSSLD